MDAIHAEIFNLLMIDVCEYFLHELPRSCIYQQYKATSLPQTKRAPHKYIRQVANLSYLW